MTQKFKTLDKEVKERVKTSVKALINKLLKKVFVIANGLPYDENFVSKLAYDCLFFNSVLC